jgi:PAS domain S-box-containing protein
MPADGAPRREAPLVGRHDEELFHLSVEAVTDYAIFMLDPAGRVSSWNTGAERLKGYTAEEIVGQHVSVFYSAEDVARGTPEALLRMAADTGRSEDEGWRVRKDGSRFLANVVITALRTPDGVLRGFSKVTRDITEHRRIAEALRASETKFRGLVDSAPDGIVMATTDGRIAFANAQAAKIFGYAAGELDGQPVEVLLPERLRDRHLDHRARYQAAPATRSMGLGMDLVGLRKDGVEVPVEISLSPMPTSEGLLVISVIRDITERKRTEAHINALNESLARRVAELDAVNRELEAFSYSVSHDLRAPLRGIDGFSHALLEDYESVLDDQGKDYLRRIRAATQRMAELIDDLLALSRVTRREMRRESVDLTALARTVATQLERAEPGRRVDWVIADGVRATGDGALLRLLLENLLGNAWKFTSKQDLARIEFGTVAIDGGLAYVVRDNGVGFDMAHAAKLFGAFQRLHSTREFSGTGIGLATVQRVVHRHGGRVWAEAEPGKGASFYFTL